MGASRQRKAENYNIAQNIKAEYLDSNYYPVDIKILSDKYNRSYTALRKILAKYNLTEVLGSDENQKEFLTKRLSASAKIREANKTLEQKQILAEKKAKYNKEKWASLTPEERIKKMEHFRTLTPEQENARREKISNTERNRSKDEKARIVKKRKTTLTTKYSETELTAIHKKAGKSLSNHIANLTEEQRKERNRKTGEGRKKAYEKETPEDKARRLDKIRKTCLERYGCEWFTLSHKMKNSGRMHSKTNLVIQSYLESRGVIFDGIENAVEFGLDCKSFDFKINKYLIEINPSATHNIDWHPFGNHRTGCISIDYHRQKSDIADANNYICIHIFDWMNYIDIFDKILSNKYEVIVKSKPYTYYLYDIKNRNLIDAANKMFLKPTDSSIVRIVDDGRKLIWKKNSQK